MLLTSTYYPHMPNQHHATHAPLRSSPLRDRSANASASFFDFSMASEPSNQQPIQLKRAYKDNPIIQTRDAATKRRRDMFFKRVQNSRDDKKWESRGEQIQQLDFVSERRRWEIKKAQEAPSEEYEIDDELLSDASVPHLLSNTTHPGPETTEADYILALEEYEFQQLIASMDQDRSLDGAPQHYGSDDEDYDQIFMECVTNVDSRQPQQPQGPVNYYKDVDDMDMTDG